MNKDKRAKFNKKAKERGDKAEAYLDTLLKKLCKKYGFSYIWYNEKGETYKSWDFAIFKDKKVRFLIECESKHFKYEKFFKNEGIDLVYRKVKRNYPAKCYYFMPICSDDGYNYILYNDIETIRKNGYKKKKTTARDKNILESFWRIPFNEMKIIKGDIVSI